MKTSGIYCLRNIANGKVYVGQALNIKKRKREHYWYLRAGCHPNEHLQRAFMKDGLDSFVFHVLEEVHESILDAREQSWIKLLQADQMKYGYNIEPGGHHNKRLSEQTRQKISDAKTGKPLTAEHRKRLSQVRKGATWLVGRVLSNETRRKISLAKIGKHPSAETLLKMSEARKGNPVFSEHCRRLAAERKGKHLSVEHRQKLSEVQMGRQLTPEHCRHIAEGNRGKHPSLESRRKMSELRRGRPWSVKQRENFNNRKLAVGREEIERVTHYLASNRLVPKVTEEMKALAYQIAANMEPAMRHESGAELAVSSQ